MTLQPHNERFDLKSVSVPDVPGNALGEVAEVAKGWVHARLRDEGRWQGAVAAYLACIYYADAQMARLIAALGEIAYER